ncbi:MAG: DUF1501 domain-containing protein [Candidatus Sumerlaeota bacterium]|nr:DUF1501 domain-containing protein [Candidatus Sumerlaeota bacterium]
MNKNQSQESNSTREGLNRRGFIGAGAMAALGLTLGGCSSSPSGSMKSAEGKIPPAKAKAVIQLWMGGGPPHTDTFDPKPDAGEEYCGPLRKAIETNVPGIRIGELLPLMAKQADKYSIIRSMTHPSGGHETATYIVMTGTLPSPALAYPSIGSVVALKKGYEAGYKGNIPPYIVVASPLGRFSETGFLGAGYRAFATGGDPSAKEFRVGGLVPARGMTEKQMEDRRALLQIADSYGREREKEAQFQTAGALQDKAYSMILGGAKKAFDLSEEKDELRDRYGRNRFGQSCLLARRLVENGSLFVTVNDGGWDTHSNHFPAMQKKLPILDQGFSALLEDLSRRGLLESTIVVWYGEFGRTPKVALEPPWNGGRHHFAQCFSCVVAGGGFKGGKVVGASDNKGEKPAKRPVYPWDLSASIYRLLGIDPNGKLPNPQGNVAYVTPLASGTVESGGMLTEIM